MCQKCVQYEEAHWERSTQQLPGLQLQLHSRLVLFCGQLRREGLLVLGGERERICDITNVIYLIIAIVFKWWAQVFEKVGSASPWLMYKCTVSAVMIIECT